MANICDICGEKGVRVRKVARLYGRGTNRLVIENVPMMHCPNCGESYLTADTLHTIERVKKDADTDGKVEKIRVAQF